MPSSRGSSWPRDGTGLLHCRRIPYHLSRQGSPLVLWLGANHWITVCAGLLIHMTRTPKYVHAGLCGDVKGKRCADGWLNCWTQGDWFMSSLLSHVVGKYIPSGKKVEERVKSRSCVQTAHGLNLGVNWSPAVRGTEWNEGNGVTGSGASGQDKPVPGSFFNFQFMLE